MAMAPSPGTPLRSVLAQVEPLAEQERDDGADGAGEEIEARGEEPEVRGEEERDEGREARPEHPGEIRGQRRGGVAVAPLESRGEGAGRLAEGEPEQPRAEHHIDELADLP